MVATFRIFFSIFFLSLQGAVHTVVTGLVLIFRDDDQTLREVKCHESTQIEFSDLSDEIIESYVESNEPL